MDTQIEASRARTPVVRKAFAGLVLVVAAALILKLVIGFVIGDLLDDRRRSRWCVAVLWAVKTLVW